MTTPQRIVYYISDATGITVESLGRSVLAQFQQVSFTEKMLTFVDNADKVADAAAEIRRTMETADARPIVFCTFTDDHYKQAIRATGALMLDCLEIFMSPLTAELGCEPDYVTGGRFSSTRDRDYQRRINALNFTMYHDDGAALSHLSDADIILVGVSRSGKTPTSFYLALHYGIFSANYPLVDEDLTDDTLPASLVNYADKLYGLSISPQRLAHIRDERLPGSRYADLDKCQQEVRAARRIFENNRIPYLDVTTRSIEELAAKILQEAKLTRYL